MAAAASGGHVAAQIRLGAMYARWPDRDDVESMRYFVMAADAGDADAQAHVAERYRRGHGVRADAAVAATYARLAADQGSIAAMCALAEAHLAGAGVARDARAAADLYARATAAGSRYAPAVLGAMYEEGFGVDRDPVAAAECYERAVAKRGWRAFRTRARSSAALADAERLCVTDTLFRLGVMYTEGRGVPHDLTRACELLGRAAGRGDGRAHALLAGSLGDRARPTGPDSDCR
jgi:TPR repeat protein